jgi:hypothetical protein
MLNEFYNNFALKNNFHPNLVKIYLIVKNSTKLIQKSD